MPGRTGGWIAAICASTLWCLTGCSGGSAGSPAPTPAPAPAPTLTVSSIAPSNVLAGSGPTAVTVTGTGFISSTSIEVGGVSDATGYVSSTQVTATVPSSQLLTAGPLSIVATNGGSAVSASSASLQVNNPVPAITQVSPATLTAGAAAATVSVNGTGFVSSTMVEVDGQPRAATFGSGTQLTAVLTDADLAVAGTHSMTVVNAAPGGGTSAAAIAVNNPTPSLLTLNPAAVTTGTSAPTTITVNGGNFLPVSTAQVGGSPRLTTYVSGTRLTFQLTTADEAKSGNLNVAIVNPAPGGGASSTAVLTVANAPSPVSISSVTPSTLSVHSPPTSISVLGTGFTNQSVVQWNGTNLATSYGNCFVSNSYSGCLIAAVPASLLTATGTADIRVYSSASTPAYSNTLQVAITDPAPPTLASLSVNAGPTNTAVAIGLTGTGFLPTSSVLLNGSSVPTDFVNSTSLTANVPASLLATPGVFPVTVMTPSPGGGTSAAQYFTAYVAIPNNSMAYSAAGGLFYLSVPSAAGPPYGNTIVPVDPLTGSLGTPIPVGSEPNRLAITADGKYLWVALDGAAAVRQVDLTTGTAGLQFPIGPSGSSTYTVAALAALPGSPNSVVVSSYYGGYTTPTGVSLTIYDSGVARPNAISFSTYAPFPWALLVNGTTREIYGPGSVLGPGAYITYSYGANGVTQKTSTNSSLTYAESNNDDVQVTGSTLYTDYGQGVNAETGALLGTFYSSGTTVAQGSVVVDTVLNKAFILEGADDAFAVTGSGLASATLGAFNIADYSAIPATPINVGFPVYRASYQYAGPTGPRLTRWGSDGLAFRSTGGFVSLRTNLVKDLSSVNADVAVSVAAPSLELTGTATTFTVRVTNHGPSGASGVSLVAEVPSPSALVSAVPSTGSCTPGSPVVCDLAGLASGTSTNIVFTVLPVSAGTATLSAQVSASETDPTLSNNSGSASVTVSGSAYNLLPRLTSISPAGIASGSPDTQITLTGTGFSSGATVALNGTIVQTSFVSPTQLTATVPAAGLAALGWAGVTVSNPSPGGGTSATVPLYVFSVLGLNASDIVYDPYSRRIMAGLSTGTSTLAANSLVAITPDTASVGTPVVLAGTPSSLAITSDGQFVYALLPSATAASVGRFNMLTGRVDMTATGFQPTGYNTGLRDLATQPGSPNTIAVDEGEYPGTSIFDFNATTQVATRRGAATGIYTGTCLSFPNASQLFITDLYTSGSLLKNYGVTANGLINGSYPYYGGADLAGMNCTKVDGNLLFGQAGGVASLLSPLPTQTGTFEGMPFVSTYGSGIKDYAPDASLGLSFYLTSMNPNQYSAIFDSITAFDIATYMPSSVLTLPFSTFEPGGSGFTGVNMVRWGQDGLAILSSGGNIYLVRGPAVVPGLLGTSTAATLILSSSPALTHGSGNVLLTLTGRNFQPGVAVTWNGSYRSTTNVSPTQVTVAIPSSDVAKAGTATLVATNPGAPASAAITITVQ